MAKTYTLSDIVGSATLNPTKYNANNSTIIVALAAMLSRQGVNEANNSMLGSLDFNGFSGVNLKTPTLAGDIMTKGYGDANYGGASVTLAQSYAVAASASADLAADWTVIANGYANDASASADAALVSETNAAASEAAALSYVGAVKVSANDTTPGVLNGKLVAGTNVTLVEGSDGGNETLTVNATLGQSTSTVSADGDFTGGSFTCTKIGNQVVVSFSGLTHASLATAASAVGLVPAAYRPAVALSFCIGIGPTVMEKMIINTNGSITVQYFDWAGTLAARSGIGGAGGAVSYNVA